jgi:hypothetical protein
MNLSAASCGVSEDNPVIRCFVLFLTKHQVHCEAEPKGELASKPLILLRANSTASVANRPEARGSAQKGLL